MAVYCTNRAQDMFYNTTIIIRVSINNGQTECSSLLSSILIVKVASRICPEMAASALVAPTIKSIVLSDDKRDCPFQDPKLPPPVISPAY